MIIESTCRTCKVVFTYNSLTSGGLYCSNKCQMVEKHNDNIKNWLNGEIESNSPDGQLKKFVKDFIKERDGNKCTRCGWNEINPFTGKSPLEVHHRDENHENSTPENLITLCPNCHSLTRSWKNSGRSKRMERYYKKQSGCEIENKNPWIEL